MTSEQRGQKLIRKQRNAISNPIHNPRTHVVERLGEQIAGSRRIYRGLSKQERSAIRLIASQMHDNGREFSRAKQREGTDKRGFVYVIVNPAWEDYCKIGRAFDPESRLRGYQTATPFRDFHLYGARYFADAALAEREMHMRLDEHREEGEWFYLDPARALQEIDKLQEQLYVG
jgi:hypothetical protein